MLHRCYCVSKMALELENLGIILTNLAPSEMRNETLLITRSLLFSSSKYVLNNVNIVEIIIKVSNFAILH